MFAITETSYRAIAPGMDLAPGETRVDELPTSLLTRIRGEQMRSDRSQRLRSTDWTQMDDAPLTALEKAAYQTYRQALRDLPSLPGFPDVEWPALPTIKEGTAGTGEGSVYP